MAAPELDPEQWRRLKPVLTEAARLSPPERMAFLEARLGSDTPLRSRALAMLRLHDGSARPFTEVTDGARTTGIAVDGATATLAPGRSIGYYSIVRQLGEGGMGRVYLALDQRLGRSVALKVLQSSHAPDAGRRRAQVIAESRSIAVLNHPGIVVLYDIFEHDEELLLVMEYVEGRALSDAITAGPIPSPFATRLIVQIADAVAYAHARGVLHCDLKPANVHLLPTGVIKVLDFGLARILTGSLHEGADQQQVVGTLGYLSPEQLSFHPPSAASDMYALGVIAYELLTGQPPCGREALIFDTVNTTPARPSSLVAGLPLDVDEAVMRCLAKNPRERLQAHELAAALRRHRASEPPSSPAVQQDPDPVRVPAAPGRFRPGTAVLIGVLLLLSAAGTTTLVDRSTMHALWRSVRPGPVLIEASSASVAILPTTGALQQPEATALGRALPTLLRAALSSGGDLNVLVLDDDATPAEAAPQLAMHGLGAMLAVRCVLTPGPAGDAIEVELYGNDSLAPVFHARVDVDADKPPVTFERVLAAVDRALETRVRRRPARKPEIDGPGLLPSGLALNHFADALQLLDRLDVAGNVDRATALLQSAIQKDPTSAVAHAALARAQWLRYQNSRSEDMARQATASAMTALTLNNDLVSVKLTAAIIQRGTGELERAEHTLVEVIAQSPVSDEAHRLLGEVLAAREQHEASQREFDTAIALRPLYWRNHSAKGLALYERGDYDDATRSFIRVTELQPDSSWGFQMLGATMHQLARYNEAVAAYDRALTLGPTAAAWSNIGKLHYDNGRYERAVAAYQEALKIRAGSPVTWRNLGDVLAATGRAADARAAYQQAEGYALRATRVNPSDPASLSTLAVIHAKLGRATQALEEVDRAVALAPNDRTVHFRRAVVLMLAGAPVTAQEAIDRAIELGFSASEARLDRDLGGLTFGAR